MAMSEFSSKAEKWQMYACAVQIWPKQPRTAQRRAAIKLQCIAITTFSCCYYYFCTLRKYRSGGGGVKTKIEISWNGCVLLSLKCADYIMTPSRTHSSMHGHITQFATDKRVYDVDVLMYDGDSLVSCMHGLAWHWHPVIWRMTVCLSPYWRSR